MTQEQKQWIEKRIVKIIHTADMVKDNAPYVSGLAETIKRDVRKLKKFLLDVDKENECLQSNRKK